MTCKRGQGIRMATHRFAMTWERRESVRVCQGRDAAGKNAAPESSMGLRGGLLHRSVSRVLF